MSHSGLPLHTYPPHDRIIHIRELEQRDTTPRGSQKWKVSVSCGTYHAVVNLTNPFTSSQEARLSWALEEHPAHHPFETQKSRAISKELWGYSLSLIDQLNLHEVLTYPYPEDVVGRRSMGGRNRVRQGIESSVQDIKGRRWYIDIEGPWGGSTESMIQGLHWEVLENSEIWPSHLRPCLIVRRKVPSNDILTRGPIIAIRSDTFRILLVVGHSLRQSVPSRVGGGTVANPRLTSRPLVDIIGRITKEMGGNTAPIQLEIVRPGTWRSLEAHLKSRGKGYFHLIHFDVHGKMTQDKSSKTEIVSLAFVSDNSPKKRSWRSATEVSSLISTFGVKLVVINASRTSQAFGACTANIAGTFIRDGVRAVIALPYSVLNTGMELLISTFYKCFLSESWDFAIALSEARKSMLRAQLREGRFGIKVPVEDWVIPTLYHSGGTEVSVVAGDDISGDLTSVKHAPKSIFSKFHGLLQPTIPDPALLTVGSTDREARQPRCREEISQGDIVGRDIDIFKIEMMLDTSILRILGPPGVGKSTLVAHLGWWWKSTSLVKDYFYFDWYEKPHLNIEMITRQLYLLLFPPKPNSRSGNKECRSRSPMREALMQHLSRSRSPSPTPNDTEIFPDDWIQRTMTELRETPYLIALDSLESSDASTKHNEWLKGEINEFLQCLQGGKTVVLVISNQQDCWLNDSIVKFSTYHLKELEMAHGIELLDRMIKRYGCDRKRFPGSKSRQYQQRLMRLSEMNPLVMGLTLPNIALYDDSPKSIFLGLLQGAIPFPKSDPEPTHSIKPMRNIANLLSRLDKDSQQLLLCLAPFWTRLPKDIEPYIHSLLYHKALVSTTDSLQNLAVSRKPSELEKQRVKSVMLLTGLLTRYEYMIQDLLSLELLTDGDITDASGHAHKHSSKYYRIHPLLTLFLRQAIAKEQESPKPKIIGNYNAVTSAFLDYYTHRSAQWAESPDEKYESAAQEIRDEEINFLSAISIPLQNNPNKIFEIFPIHAYSRLASMSLVDKELSPNASLMAYFGDLILQNFDSLYVQHSDRTLGESAVEIALFASNWLCEYHSENSPMSVFKKQVEKSIELMRLANTISPNCKDTLAMLEEQATKQKSTVVSGGIIEGLRLRKPWNGLVISDVIRETTMASRIKDDSDEIWMSLAMTFSRLQSVAVQAPLVARFSPALSQQLKKDLKLIWDNCVNSATGTDLEPFLSSYEWVAQSLETSPLNKDEPPAEKKSRISSSAFLGYPEFVRSQLMLQLRDIASAKRYLLDGLQRARTKSNHSAEILLHTRLCDLTFELRNWNECIAHVEWIRDIMVPLGEDLSTDDFKAFAQATWRKGICHNHLHQWEAALEAFSEALGVCRHIHDRVTEYAILRKIAAIKRESGLGDMTVTDALLKALEIAYNPLLARDFAIVGEQGILLQRIISSMTGKRFGESRESVIARLACARETCEQEMLEFIDELMTREKELLTKDANMGIPLHETEKKVMRLYAEAERIIFDSPKAMSKQPLVIFAGSKWERGLLSKGDCL